MTKISVFIIAYNEEKIIARCLEKLYWADEVIVVDSGSTDNTIAICKEFNAKVIFNQFENFGKQKQFALSQTTNDWVLSLDADEVLTDALINEIKNHSFSNEINGYLIPRTHIFLGKIFKYGNENKKPILRLFNKSHGRFLEQIIHETIEVNGRIGTFRNEMFHFTVFDISTAIQKQIKYALLSGEFLNVKNKKPSKIRTIIKFPYEFVRSYFIQLNFLNGYQGFVWSLLAAFSSFVKYAKLIDIYQNKEE